MYEKRCSGILIQHHGENVNHHGKEFGWRWIVARAVNKWPDGNMAFEFPDGEVVPVCELCRNVLRAFAVLFVCFGDERTNREIVRDHIRHETINET